ncbi:MAG: chorismate synthase [Synergistaceae bacterium]|jgi:chorismate synthase|nr:chorismate synthase [Synergistaceae bacterium]
MNVWGNKLRLSIFGESHGDAIGVVVDGLPAGELIDRGGVSRDMLRRAPGRDAVTTARRESDGVEILSGLLGDRTTGFPICGVIRNSDARSRDYGTKLRPGHADWTALLKYRGFADMRGGGHFSGRLTAPLVFAGSLAKQILSRRGVEVFARAASVARVSDPAFSGNSSALGYRAISGRDFPASEEAEEAMRAAIMEAKAAGDSVGGVVEAAAFGVRGGLGEPFFGSMESSVASLLFSVPAVKGVEFGDGFRLAAMRGSEANDAPYMDGDVIKSRTNHNGGILGGITNGMPLVVRAAIKPTASVSIPQETVDASDMSGTTITVAGRHDPCIVPRAVPVVEACLALCVLDALLSAGGIPA